MSANSDSAPGELPETTLATKELGRRRSRIVTVWKVAASAAVLIGTVLVLATSYVLSSVRGTVELQNADAMINSERFAEAVSLYTAALGERLSDGQRALALGNRGWAYTKLNRDPDAIRDFDAALQIDPELEFALLDRGLALHRQGKFEAALADYEKTIALDPNSLDAYRNRALILAHLGRWKDAIADMTEAARCDDNNPAWLVARGDYSLRDSEPESALASYESAIRIDPENIDALWGRAKIFARQNQLDRAVGEMTEAIRARPSSARLYLARGLM